MKLRINVEGKTYEVEVEILEEGPPGPLYGSTSVHGSTVIGGATPAAAAPPAPPAEKAPAAPAPSGGSDRCVKAPIAGVIVQPLVAPGDAVAVNQVLLTMEAMKMETNVASPLDGKVRTVRVSPGESVKAGQVLIEFE
ncbi:Methylmalonyl-CoA carboxyltransferase 1.3S subunit [Posidoniimonas polymericola]|uniref:Methylmalonyl-CoA carboxyltransferase 1.3S subunit n=1 Tax=Posidoniimonas polymericola TaxID=2528002 RepID=A0A5C5XYF7_9BACT|nr:acetyl-CoA carboxylase biotin carboxyl carrier protein subunit [Posidoniimonas polymericola]TWT66965.1 Methylmalonyl-CoA carboxyltransferase 1.3S subunit [Posidoniimonas polymericola]